MEQDYKNLDLSKILNSQSIAATTSLIKIEENRNREWGLYGRDTGIHDLNMAIGGIIPSEIITIGGRSGHGKTSLLTPFAWATQRETDVLSELCMFSWEMPAYRLVDRMITHKTGLTNRDLMIGAKLLSEDNLKSIKNTIEEAKKVRAVYQEKSISPEYICNIFRKFCDDCKVKEDKDGIKRHPIGIIDFVGLTDFDSSGIRTYGIGELYRNIKQMCNETGGSFIILAQINRGSDNKDAPDRGDLADSQAIEQSSDILALIHRPEYLGKQTMIDPKTKEEIDTRNKALIRIQKGRTFGISDFVVGCDISRYKFWSLDQNENYNYWKLYKDPNFWKEYFGYGKAADGKLPF